MSGGELWKTRKCLILFTVELQTEWVKGEEG